MLALMPRSSLLPLDSHMSTDSSSSRRPLALLPSTPMSFNQQSGAAFSSSPSPAKRPKLSLNTSSVSPIFGKGATSLRLETLSATSPTARNTFSNRYDGVSPAADTTQQSQKPVLTPIATNLSSTSSDAITPPADSLEDDDTTDSSYSRSRTASLTSIASTVSTISTVDSAPYEVPYRLPFNATSILSNGPIPRDEHRKLSFSQSRPMFPALKKVGFRAPLTEEVKNTKFTLRHSDIDPASPAVSALSKDETPEDSTLSSPVGVKRDSEDAEHDNDAGNAATPVSGRAKRHRWVWTLAPVKSASAAATTSESIADGS